MPMMSPNLHYWNMHGLTLDFTVADFEIIPETDITLSET